MTGKIKKPPQLVEMFESFLEGFENDKVERKILERMKSIVLLF